jgi:hypothetical protein
MLEFDGCGCATTPDEQWGERWPQAHYMAAALIGEFTRVTRWTRRHDPDTGLRNSWLEAMWHVAENPPSFDAQWDEAFEDKPVLVVLPH